MHEWQFTEQIVRCVLDAIKNYSDKKVKAVKIKVGETYHLEPESVKMHFRILTSGTSLAGVDLDLQQEPMIVSCAQCGHVGPVDDHHLLTCSSCYSMTVKPIAGNTISIESIELEQRC